MREWFGWVPAACRARGVRVVIWQLVALRKAHDEELAMSRQALERGDKHAADTHTNTAAKV
jgi:hypothetical protein